MFSPFTTSQGAPKALAEVAWDDLAQLADLDEGYVLEFKQTFSQPVRKKIPKIIASFSNSAGGWIVIGIADKTKAVCPVPRLPADYSQVIGELARRHVTPTPRFDVRFLPDPGNAAQGVVLVQVFEGDFPPYVADGVVEVREGSTSGPAAGTALVELYGKATRRRDEVQAFCRRTVYYASPRTPLFNLYLFRLGRRVPEAPSRDEVNEHASAMRAAFRRQGLACRVQHAHDSLIFSVPAKGDPRVPHSAIELFSDESLKLTVPIVLLAGDKRARALARLRALTAGEKNGAEEKRGAAGEKNAGDKSGTEKHIAADEKNGVEKGAAAPAAAASMDGPDATATAAEPAAELAPAAPDAAGGARASVSRAPFTDGGVRSTAGADSSVGAAGIPSDAVALGPAAADDLLARTAAAEPLRLMSAEDTLARVTRMAAVLDRYTRLRELPWQQYAVAYELENMAGALLWSEEEQYRAYVAENGPLYCATVDGLSRVRYLDDGAHDAFRARQFAGSHFFEACGLPLGSPDKRDNDLVDALLRTTRGAQRT